MVHRDLWVDNFLFYNDKVSAILDFDRMDYDYVELDIGRTVISCALHDGVLNKSLVASFLEGYRNELDFPVGNIVRQFKCFGTWRVLGGFMPIWISIVYHLHVLRMK